MAREKKGFLGERREDEGESTRTTIASDPIKSPTMKHKSRRSPLSGNCKTNNNNNLQPRDLYKYG